MTNPELIARLRDWPYQGETMAGEAADRIEALEAKLARAVGFLEAWIEVSENCSIEEGVCCCGDNMEKLPVGPRNSDGI